MRVAYGVVVVAPSEKTVSPAPRYCGRDVVAFPNGPCAQGRKLNVRSVHGVCGRAAAGARVKTAPPTPGSTCLSRGVSRGWSGAPRRGRVVPAWLLGPGRCARPLGAWVARLRPLGLCGLRRKEDAVHLPLASSRAQTARWAAVRGGAASSGVGDRAVPSPAVRGAGTGRPTARCVARGKVYNSSTTAVGRVASPLASLL